MTGATEAAVVSFLLLASLVACAQMRNGKTTSDRISTRIAANGNACGTCKTNPYAQHGRGVTTLPCGDGAQLIAADAAPTISVFLYATLMGCKKLEVSGVHGSQSAQRAYIPGQCFRWTKWDSSATDDQGWGNLVPCEDGCVHGVVHKIPRSQLAALNASAPGYVLVEFKDVTGYDGSIIQGENWAYVMQGETVPEAAPSIRHAGFLYCTIVEELSVAYAEQFACELAAIGIGVPETDKCSSEKFQPICTQCESLVRKEVKVLKKPIDVTKPLELHGDSGKGDAGVKMVHVEAVDAKGTLTEYIETGDDA